MCKHCERLVEDADAKDLVHRFMERTAANINRDNPDHVPVTANDLRVTITWNAQPMSGAQIVERLTRTMHE